MVKLLDVFEIDGTSFCTVLEFGAGNDLDLFLKTHKSVGEKEARSIVSQVLFAFNCSPLTVCP